MKSIFRTLKKFLKFNENEQKVHNKEENRRKKLLYFCRIFASLFLEHICMYFYFNQFEYFVIKIIMK